MKQFLIQSVITLILLSNVEAQTLEQFESQLATDLCVCIDSSVAFSPEMVATCFQKSTSGKDSVVRVIFENDPVVATLMLTDADGLIKTVKNRVAKRLISDCLPMNDKLYDQFHDNFKRQIDISAEQAKFKAKLDTVTQKGIPQARLGFLYYMQDDLPMAKQYLNQSIASKNNLDIPHLFLAMVALKESNIAESAELLKQVNPSGLPQKFVHMYNLMQNRVRLLSSKE